MGRTLEVKPYITTNVTTDRTAQPVIANDPGGDIDVQGRVNPLPQLSFEPTYSINAVDLAEGSFTTHLLGTRFTYTMTPWMFTSALVQYNSSTHAVSANVRLRWEYQPGSEFFLVFNEQRDTAARHFPELTNRAVVLKFNRLFRY